MLTDGPDGSASSSRVCNQTCIDRKRADVHEYCNNLSFLETRYAGYVCRYNVKEQTE
jgi:hypothetical protein